MKDPYLRPVIIGGLFITMLSTIFAPGIFLWSILGGYLTVRLTSKVTKELFSKIDVLLLGIFTGIVGGTSIDILTAIAFKTTENQRLLIRTIEKNWPKDISLPNLKEMLPSIFITTCIFIIVISVIFAIIGAYIGMFISKKKKQINT